MSYIFSRQSTLLLLLRAHKKCAVGRDDDAYDRRRVDDGPVSDQQLRLWLQTQQDDCSITLTVGEKVVGCYLGARQRCARRPSDTVLTAEPSSDRKSRGFKPKRSHNPFFDSFVSSLDIVPSC